jgi:uncharacterized delta-60 repeat protein
MFGEARTRPGARQQQMASQIVFVDQRVLGRDAVFKNSGADTDWVIIDDRQDGLLQMQQALVGRGGLSSIHIVSHGESGALYLGTSVVHAGTLQRQAAALRAVGQSLSADGDILIYGCDVAQGAAGQAFVNAWARSTGADVAASVDATGAAAWGGNFTLESTVGAVESRSLPLQGVKGLLGVNTAPTFSGPDGKLQIDLGAEDSLRGITLQRDGKILLVGVSFDTSSPILPRNYAALLRLNADGSLDTTFGLGGEIVSSFGLTASTDVFSNAAVVQSDGKILLAGSDGPDFVLFRLARDGSLDTGFAQGGVAVADVRSGWDNAFCLAAQADGKIILAGTSLSVGGNDFALVRYNANGSLDTSFDGDGKLTTDFGGNDFARSVMVLPGGKILVSGSRNTDLVVARYNANGSLDNSFGVNGKLFTDVGTYGGSNNMAVQADGKIVVVGHGFSQSGGEDFRVARFNANGTMDTGFGAKGLVTTNISSDMESDSAYSVALQSDGKIVVAGYSSSSRLALVRYNANGTLDTSFGNAGRVVTHYEVGNYSGYSESWNYSLALQGDGKILLATSRGVASGPDFTLLRFNSNGSLDLGFSPGVNTLGNRVSCTEGSFYNDHRVVLSPQVHIFDAELCAQGKYAGSTVRLVRHGGANAQDVFGNFVAGTLSSLTTGSDFSVDGVTIGRVLGNAGGQLSLSFNGHATQALLDRALQQITYANLADAPPASVQVDWVFSDGNAGLQGAGGNMNVTGSTTVLITPENDVPLLDNSLPERKAVTGSAFSFALPANIFHDPDGDVLAYSLSMSNGAAVPSWISVDAATGTLRGMPDILGPGVYSLRLTARDLSGASVYGNFKFTVTAPKNLVAGTAGNDMLTGGQSNDVLCGLAGNDTLDGREGSDTMAGGEGSDIYYVRDAGDVVSETNAAAAGGVDTVFSQLSAYALGSNVENGRVLSTGIAKMVGNALNNTLFAGAGNNVLDGGAGVDTVSYLYAAGAVQIDLGIAAAQATGASGSDQLLNVENLVGSAFNDKFAGNAAGNRLDGGAGNDTLIGGGGLDVLTGGAGRDVFRFADLPGAGTVDTLTDFRAVDDNLEFDDAVFRALGPVGRLASGAFALGTAAAEADDRLIYSQATGELRYDADGKGTQFAAVLLAKLTPGTALSAADLFVI